jgi:hypothetical protein
MERQCVFYKLEIVCQMWCLDEPNVLKAYNNERTYVTDVHFIVFLGTVRFIG